LIRIIILRIFMVYQVISESCSGSGIIHTIGLHTADHYEFHFISVSALTGLSILQTLNIREQRFDDRIQPYIIR